MAYLQLFVRLLCNTSWAYACYFFSTYNSTLFGIHLYIYIRLRTHLYKYGIFPPRSTDDAQAEWRRYHIDYCCLIITRHEVFPYFMLYA